MKIAQLLKRFDLDAIVGVDWETYFDDKYSLRHMDTTDYIVDPQFKAHCVSVQSHADRCATVLTPSDFKKRRINWSRVGVLCHHAHFDGLILSHHFGIRPKMFFCTMSMGAPLLPIQVSRGLDGMCKAMGLKGKVGADSLEAVKGVRNMTPAQYKKLAKYAGNDIQQTWLLFKKLLPYFPVDELLIVDMTVQMYTNPQIVINRRKMLAVVKFEQERKQALLDVLKLTKDDLSKNARFIGHLRAAGVEPPMKISPTKFKDMEEGDEITDEDFVPALAASDLAFKQLLAHPRKRIRQLVEARFAIKSALLESKATRLAERAKIGPASVYLNYAKAKTWRWTGGDGMNWQNLTSKRKPGGQELRAALEAPKDYVFIIADQAQIEARGVAWFCRQENIVDAFRNKRDVYKEAAADVYRKNVEDVSPAERFVGKTCIAEGTPVLCERGWVPIELVTVKDRVWDGKNWVTHQGLINNGSMKIELRCGVWLTPDHQVFIGETSLRADAFDEGSKIRTQALAFAAENLPLPGTYSEYTAFNHCSLSATVTSANTPYQEATSNYSKALDAGSALIGQVAKSNTGSTQPHYLMTNIARGYSIGSLQQFRAAMLKAAVSISRTAAEVLQFIQSGVSHVLRFLGTYKLALGGIAQNSTWIESTTTKATCRVTSDSYRNPITLKTKDKCGPCNKKSIVYDLNSCGPRHRFVVLGSEGPLVVSNCILGAGFQAGGKRMASMLRIGQFGPPVDVSDDEATDIVNAYRATNWLIARGWRNTQDMVRQAFVSKIRLEHDYGIVYEGQGKNGFMHHTPTGVSMRYDHVELTDRGELTYVDEYRRRQRDEPFVHRTKLYGGILVENRTQLMARLMVAHAMRDIVKLKHTRIVMTTHDEVVCVVPKALAKIRLKEVVEIMTTPPPWAPDIPLAVDAHISTRYDK